jgi:hypothetical protein
VRPNRNAVALVPNNKENLVCSTGFCVFESKHYLEPEAIFIFLKSKYAKVQLTRRMRATMYPAVANTDILDIKVPIPSATLRAKIVERTAYAQSLRLESHRRFENINKLVNDFCDEVLGGLGIEQYDNENNIKITSRKDIFSEANRIDAEYYRPLHDKIGQLLDAYNDAQPLGNLYNRIFTGKTPAKGQYREPEEESIPIIKVGTLTNTGLNWSSVEFTSIDFFGKNKGALVKPGDILLTSSAHSAEHICKKVDVVSVIPEQFDSKCLFVGELMSLRNEGQQKIEPHYVAAFLRSQMGLTEIHRYVRGISAHIYETDIKTVRIPIPKPALVSEISHLAEEAEEKRSEAIDITRALVEEYEDEVGIDV